MFVQQTDTAALPNSTAGWHRHAADARADSAAQRLAKAVEAALSKAGPHTIGGWD